MWMSTDAYLKRLMSALEQVVAPEVEDDAARGQLYAVVDLINQLSGKIEYKSGLIERDIADGHKIMKKVLSGLESASIETPEALASFVGDLDSESAGSGLPLKFKVEEAVCETIAHFHDNRDRLGQAAAVELDRKIRDYLTAVATRDMGLMKPPMIDKISRSKRPEKR